MDLKFIYSEEATKFCKISTLNLTIVHTVKCGDFTKFCGLLRIYELSKKINIRPSDSAECENAASVIHWNY